MSKPTPIAVICADLHLSLTAPVWRSAEKSWFGAMAYQLDQLSRYAKRHGVPILCAGDVFDKWNPPPELINFAIQHLPEMYAVPGQHDLPYHIDEDIDRSAFGTMVRIGRIKLLTASPKLIRGAWIYGFGWGSKIQPTTTLQDDGLHVAIVHAYCWHNVNKFHGASNSQHVDVHALQLKSYDVAAFGDNHRGFIREYQETSASKLRTILNCGGFMRRKSDEIKRRPSIYLLYSNGMLDHHRLDISQDLYIDSPEIAAQEQGDKEIEDFVRELSTLNSDTFDFPASIRHYIEGKKETLAPGVRRILLDVITR